MRNTIEVNLDPALPRPSMFDCKVSTVVTPIWGVVYDREGGSRKVEFLDNRSGRGLREVPPYLREGDVRIELISRKRGYVKIPSGEMVNFIVSDEEVGWAYVNPKLWTPEELRKNGIDFTEFPDATMYAETIAGEIKPLFPEDHVVLG